MIGRIIEEHKTNYVISVDGVEYTGVVRGKFHLAGGEQMFPKVGDNVECEKTSDNQVVIEKILPRKSEIARSDADSASRQVMVANVDVVFIVMGLDDDFNLRRLERYLVLAKQSNVKAVVILNKADLVPDSEEYVQKVKAIAPELPVYAISASTGEGMEHFGQHMSSETVAVLLGSSGAGKSTITNWLLDENRQATGSVREDDSRGRHTTTGRQMFTLPRGGFLIDTPGMRELGVSVDEENRDAVFSDIEELKQKCKYADCDHEKSDGCAVKAALASGELDEKRLQSYRKLEREREYIQSKQGENSAVERKQKIRKLHTGYGKILKEKRGERD